MYENTKGFTLHELMTGLTILALAASMGLPTLYSFIHEHRVKTTANDLLLAALQARSEAIKRNSPVFLSARSGSWSNGWEIYADPNYNGIRDESESILLESDSPAELRIQGNRPVATYLRFSPSGKAKLAGGAFQAGTIALCHPDSKARQRELVLSKLGRLRIQVSSHEGCPP